MQRVQIIFELPTERPADVPQGLELSVGDPANGFEDVPVPWNGGLAGQGVVQDRADRINVGGRPTRSVFPAACSGDM